MGSLDAQAGCYGDGVERDLGGAWQASVWATGVGVAGVADWCVRLWRRAWFFHCISNLVIFL